MSLEEHMVALTEALKENTAAVLNAEPIMHLTGTISEGDLNTSPGEISVVHPENEEPKPKTKKAKKTKKKAAKKTEGPVEGTPVGVTLDQLVAKAQECVSIFGYDDTFQRFTDHGVEKVKELPEDKYGIVYAELEDWLKANE